MFYAERPDPLDGGRLNGAAWMDAFFGNPPFAGKSTISDFYGPEYIPWLLAIFKNSHGNSDLSAFFFRRCADLLGTHGSLGLIATNTIAQGDTRITGLASLLNSGMKIYDATSSMLWPGAAGVSVAVLTMLKGDLLSDERWLDGERVHSINSRLMSGPERSAPSSLRGNAGVCSQGCVVQGIGFILSPQEREMLERKNSRNAARIFPYLGGDEVNSKPDQGYDRFIIHFGALSLEEASEWPDLIEILEERVKPAREQLKDNAIGRRQRQYWWRFWADRSEFYTLIHGLPRCLVTSIVSKHLLFSFQPVDRIFSHRLYIFAIDTMSGFATFQSRIHEVWARLLSSTLENRLNYSSSDCFETFPFPCPDPRTVIPSLEDIGQRLYETRAKYMLETQQGLTTTYNLLKDPDCHEPRIEELRRLHEEMDRAVLAAYGWDNIPVPPYGTPTTDAERHALEAPKPVPKKGRGRKAKDGDAQGSLLD